MLPDLSPAEAGALDEAFALAGLGPAYGPNPRVGCVLLAGADTIGRGYHKGAGTAHAEIEALTDATAHGRSTRGATAVVTLEPCAHAGRTGPCAEALVEAGVSRVVFADTDPNPEAAGGASYLHSQGVDVAADAAPTRARDLNRAWWVTVSRGGRPYVTAKTAASLDGRIAALDGTSRWITSPQARAHAHALRAKVGAVIVGMGTVLADDPALSARPGGRLAAHQPLRVVMGRRDLPVGARVANDPALLRHVRSHDPADVLAALGAEEVRHVLVEGGGQILGAFWRAGLVDELQAYIAPVFLGGGTRVVGDLGIATLGDAPRWTVRETAVLGGCCWLRAEPVDPGSTRDAGPPELDDPRTAVRPGTERPNPEQGGPTCSPE